MGVVMVPEAILEKLEPMPLGITPPSFASFPRRHGTKNPVIDPRFSKVNAFLRVVAFRQFSQIRLSDWILVLG